MTRLEQEVGEGCRPIRVCEAMIEEDEKEVTLCQTCRETEPCPDHFAMDLVAAIKDICSLRPL